MTYPMRRYAIATNRLLDGRPKIASLAEVKARRRQSGDIGRNLTEVGNSTLAAIDAAYGGAGLARLITLAERSEHTAGRTIYLPVRRQYSAPQ